MTTAAYTVQVSWTTGAKATPVWVDISADVKAVTFQRGRPSDLASMMQGAATIRLKDATGKYDPQNATSPYSPNILPMKQVQVSAVYGGTTYYLFTGFLSRCEYNPDKSAQESTMEAVDLFEFLNLGKPTIGTQANKTVDQLIGTILDTLGWTAAVRTRNFTQSTHTVPSWSADGTKSALQLIQDLLTVDLGMFFVDGQGRPTYLPSTSRYNNAPAVATLDGGIVTGLRSTVDVHNIINAATVTRTGGATQSSSDATSIGSYGERDNSPITSANLADDNQAAALAQFLVLAYKDPIKAPRNVGLVNANAAALLQILGREVGDAVSVTAAGLSINGPIQSAEQDIADGGLVHSARYTVAQALTRFFTLDVSMLDGTDVLGY